MSRRMRPAEEIAREMVSDDHETSCEDSGSTVLGVDVPLPTDGIDKMRAALTAAIEQARADGAAAERAKRAASPMDYETCRALAIAALSPVQGHCSEGYECALSEVVDALDLAFEEGRETGAAAERERLRAAQPRDLAGRIRALIQEYAGRWADADGLEEPRMRCVLAELRRAHSTAKRGESVASVIASMRAEAGDYLRRAADELEAIISDCAPEAP